MRTLATAFAIGATTLFGSGCATLFGGSHQSDISFGSEPAGADVLVDGSRVGTTPANVEINSTKSHVVTLKKAGYQDATCMLDTSVGAGWIVLDVLGGVIPIVIDAVTSNWNGLSTHACNQTLS